MHYFSDGDRTKTELMTEAKQSGAAVFFLYAYETDFGNIMLAARDLELAKAGYAFIICDTMVGFDPADKKARAAAHGLLYISLEPVPPSPVYSTFVEKWRSRYFAENGVQAPTNPDGYVAATYDSVYLFAAKRV